jgi:hypothetical protein
MNEVKRSRLEKKKASSLGENMMKLGRGKS